MVEAIDIYHQERQEGFAYCLTSFEHAYRIWGDYFCTSINYSTLDLVSFSRYILCYRKASLQMLSSHVRSFHSLFFLLKYLVNEDQQNCSCPRKQSLSLKLNHQTMISKYFWPYSYSTLSFALFFSEPLQRLTISHKRSRPTYWAKLDYVYWSTCFSLYNRNKN